LIDSFAERWALITGASSGIGVEFARKLAERGMHLVLTARRKELMEQLASELDTKHGARCEIITGDLSDPAQPKKLFDEIKNAGISVELLVNNAGFSVVDEIDKTNVDRVLAMVSLNIAALTELSYLFLPEMLERGHGAIVNVSSVAGFQPVAYMGAYAASKAYVLHFSEALWAEAREQGVTVMALCPGTTRTDFFAQAGIPGWLKKHRSQTPEQVVRAALKALSKKRQYIVSGWRNYLLSLAVRLATRRTAVTESMKYFRPAPSRDDLPDAQQDTPQTEDR